MQSITKICGTDMIKRRKPEDYVGTKINMLRVDAVVKRTKGGKEVKCFSCLCDCGNNTEVIAEKVVRGKTLSCGCYGVKARKAARSTHGMSDTPIYFVWAAMKDRCNNPNNPSYYRYGGRGIAVCDEWMESFENFFSDMGKSFMKGLELDRADNDGHYTKYNCRWVTHQQNSWNRHRLVGSSKYVGVSWDSHAGKWAASIAGRYLGLFCDERDAASVYDDACIEERREFSHLNKNIYPDDFVVVM